MASTQTTIIGQYQACVLRAVRLDDDCTPLTGTSAAALTTGLATLTVDPEIEEGDVFEPKNACGDIMFSVRDCDRIKRLNIDLELLVWDFEFLELLTGASLVVGATGGTFENNVIGLEYPGFADAGCPNGASLEIWTKTASGSSQCSGSGGALYMRTLLPKVNLQFGSRTFEGDVANVTLSGYSEHNPNWGTGAYADWPGDDPVSANTPLAMALDESIPTVQSIGNGKGGYVDIP